MRFQYVTIAVSNLEKSREFYSEFLGFSETQFYEGWIGYGLEHNAGFGIIEDKNLTRRAPSDIINFVIDDFQEFWQRVSNEVLVESPPKTMPWGTKKFIVVDPDGMKIAFIEKEESK